MNDKITERELERLDFRKMEWNNGIISEYFLPITGEGNGIERRGYPSDFENGIISHIKYT